MATENLQIRITAEMAQIRQALQGLQTQLEASRKTGEKIGTAGAQGVAQLNQRLGNTARIVAGLAASLGAGLSIAGLVKASDEAANIAARLKLATKDAESFARAQRGVFEIAQRTRTSLLASVELYARIERSTREIGVNQATVLRLTETINQAAQISGGGPGAEAALFQLSQGLAAGTLRGEELISVLEQTPRLAEAIATGMNIPIGQLRKLAEEGKLTSENVLRAILSQSQTIQAEFAEFPPTIASGFTAIRNAFIQYLSTSDNAKTAAIDLANALGKIAENLPFIIDSFIRLGPVVAAAYAAFKLWPLVPIIFAAAQAALARFQAQLVLSTPLMRAAQAQALGLAGSYTAVGASSALAGAAGVTALGLIKGALGVLIAAFAGWQVGTLMRERFLAVRLAGLALVTGLLKQVENIKGAYEAAGVAIRETFINAYNTVLTAGALFAQRLADSTAKIPGVGGKISELYGEMAAKLKDNRIQSEGLEAGLRRVALATEDAKTAIDEMGMALAKGEIEAELLPSDGTGEDAFVPDSPDPDAAGKAAKLAAALAATEAELVADRVRRALEQIQRLYDGGELSIREYYAEKQQLELEAVDSALAAARAEAAAATETDQVAAANAKVVQLLRDRAEIGPAAARDQAAAERELTREIGALQIRMLQLQGETAAAARLQLEGEFEGLIKRLNANGDTAGVALAKRVINAEAFQAELDEIDRKVQDAIGRFQSVETSSGAQVEAGLLGQDTAEDRVREQREASLAVLTSMRDRYVEIQENARLANDEMSSTRAGEAIAQIDGQIAQLSINTESLGYKATQVLKGALTQLFTDLASGSKSAGDALRDFVVNFVQGMAQIAANALATYLMLKLLDAIYPGLGKATAALSGATSNHSGGMAGAGATRFASLPAFAFAGAPRYHTGGVVGLSPDEVPIIAKRGEEVLTAQDPRNRNNGGLAAPSTGSGRVTTPIVAIGDAALADALAGSAGEDVVLTHVRRNWAGLTQGGANA